MSFPKNKFQSTIKTKSKKSLIKRPRQITVLSDFILFNLL